MLVYLRCFDHQVFSTRMQYLMHHIPLMYSIGLHDEVHVVYGHTCLGIQAARARSPPNIVSQKKIGGTYCGSEALLGS